MGKLTNSLEGRYDGLIHPGVNVSADGVYSNNTITTDAAITTIRSFIRAATPNQSFSTPRI